MVRALALAVIAAAAAIVLLTAWPEQTADREVLRAQRGA